MSLEVDAERACIRAEVCFADAQRRPELCLVCQVTSGETSSFLTFGHSEVFCGGELPRLRGFAAPR